MLRCLFVFLLLIPFAAPAQQRRQPALHDTLAVKLSRDSARIYRRTLAKPYLKIENRNSFIVREPVDFYGGLVGATFWEKHTIAAGFYFLDEKSKSTAPWGYGAEGTQQFLRLSYFNFVYQHVLLNRRYLQLNLPFEVGAGSYYARTTDSSRVPVSMHHSGSFVPFSAGLQAIGKITRWLGISVAGGYRYVNEQRILLKFNGMYYSFGVWIDARQLLRNYRYHRARRKYQLQQYGRAAN